MDKREQPCAAGECASVDDLYWEDAIMRAQERAAYAELLAERDDLAARLHRRDRIFEQDSEGMARRDAEIKRLTEQCHSHAEFARFVQEAKDMRERAEKAERRLDVITGYPTPVDGDGRCWFCGGGLGHHADGHKDDCVWVAAKIGDPAQAGGGRGCVMAMGSSAARSGWSSDDWSKSAMQPSSSPVNTSP